VIDSGSLQQAGAAQSSSPSNIVINFAISAPSGTVSRETQTQIATRTAEALNHAMRRNG